MFSYLNPLPSLPQYAGPYKVGMTDYEIPVSEISPNAATIPDAQISTIKFRVYYPTRPNEVAKDPVYWLPDPQKEWNAAYASFLGANSTWTSVVSRLWSVTNYAKLPVIKNAPLLTANSKNGLHPTCFFSHGLGGNTNIYSSIVGSLASCGVVTIVPEHRDGSSPISFIKNADGEVERTISYQKLSHNPDPSVLNARNAQLRIRLWELELIYTAVKSMNEGKRFTNYAEKKRSVLDLKTQLNFSSGSVAWAGHSFGAATITQFVKSIFYHQNLPDVNGPHNKSQDPKQEWDWTPLYKTKTGSDLIDQITPESPVALLDVWTMPLRGEATRWLWDLPMPCYSRTPTTNSKPSTVAMISGEFYGYKGMQDRTRALLSRTPADAIDMIESGRESTDQELPPTLGSTFTANPIHELSKNESSSLRPPIITTSASSDSSRATSPARSTLDTPDMSSPTSSQSSLPLADADSESPFNKTTTGIPQLYHIPHSAHLSQSDFGLLFPNITKYAMKALDPEKTIETNVRAILAVMRGQGLEVKGLVERNRRRSENDYILEDDMGIAAVTETEGGEIEISRRRKEQERWVRVPLVQV